MQRIRQEWGGIDILVNNAGILRDRSIAKMTLDEWRSVLDVNLSGVFHCCKFGLEILRDGGSIVCVGSLAAKMGFHGQSNYAAAKAGVQALVRVLARECARRSIRVNAVAPGVIDTPMMAQVSEAARAQLAQSIALRRLGRPRRGGRGGPLPLLAAGQLHHRACPRGRRRIPGLTTRRSRRDAAAESRFRPRRAVTIAQLVRSGEGATSVCPSGGFAWLKTVRVTRRARKATRRSRRRNCCSGTSLPRSRRSPPRSRRRSRTASPGEVFDLAGGDLAEAESDADPVAPPIPVTPRERPAARPRDAARPKTARPEESSALEAEALVDEVWSRGAEWGPNLVVRGRLGVRHGAARLLRHGLGTLWVHLPPAARRGRRGGRAELPDPDHAGAAGADDPRAGRPRLLRCAVAPPAPLPADVAAPRPDRADLLVLRLVRGVQGLLGREAPDDQGRAVPVR